MPLARPVDLILGLMNMNLDFLKGNNEIFSALTECATVLRLNQSNYVLKREDIVKAAKTIEDIYDDFKDKLASYPIEELFRGRTIVRIENGSIKNIKVLGRIYSCEEVDHYCHLNYEGEKDKGSLLCSDKDLEKLLTGQHIGTASYEYMILEYKADL